MSSAGMMRGDEQGTRCHSPCNSRKTGIMSRICLSAAAAKTRAAFCPGNSSFHVAVRTRAACSLCAPSSTRGGVPMRSNLPGPLHGFQGPFYQGAFREGIQLFHGFQCKCCVFNLVRSGKRGAGSSGVRPRHSERGEPFPCRPFDDGHGFRFLNSGNDGFSGGDDRRLFSGNFRKGVSQILLVVQPDGSQYGDVLARALVASSLPPRPVSRMMKSAPLLMKWRRATARASSKKVGAVPILPQGFS